jgi:hypothetical protein
MFFSYFFSILVYQYYFSYLSSSFHTLTHIFLPDSVSSSAEPCIQPTDPIFFVIFDLQMPAVVPLFVLSSASGTVEPPRLLPLFSSKNDVIEVPLLLPPSP